MPEESPQREQERKPLTPSEPHSLQPTLPETPMEKPRGLLQMLGDSSRSKGVAESEHLKTLLEEFLKRHVEFVKAQGLWADLRYTLGTDTIESLVQICQQVAKEFPRTVFCARELVFAGETFLRHLLHNQAATLQRRLQFAGLQVIVLPIRAL
jgi:hypothetical protein